MKTFRVVMTAVTLLAAFGGGCAPKPAPSVQPQMPAAAPPLPPPSQAPAKGNVPLPTPVTPGAGATK